MLSFFAAMPSCLSGIEACSAVHHWAREITALGYGMRLVPPSYVRDWVEFVSRNPVGMLVQV